MAKRSARRSSYAVGQYLDLARVDIQIGRIIEATSAEIGEALTAEAQTIMAKALVYVPKKTGELARSAYVDPPREWLGGAVSLNIGFTAGHSVVIHERLDLQHLPPTRSKYLQAAVEESLPGLTERVALRVAAAQKRSL